MVIIILKKYTDLVLAETSCYYIINQIAYKVLF